MAKADIDDKKTTVFQYAKELDIPLYLECELPRFSTTLVSFLNSHRFEVITGEDVKKMRKRVQGDKASYLISMEPASASVERQLESTLDGDKYGAETISPRDGYRVYRYKNMALTLFASSVPIWKLGVCKDFGTKDFQLESSMTLSRLISFALAQRSIVGIFGVFVDGGIVAMKPRESLGEVVYIDLQNKKVITREGVKPINSSFVFMRLDTMLKGRTIRMKKEELLSYLFVTCSYFDSLGLSVPVRQMIQKITQVAEGIIYPKDYYKPRTDLSL